MTDEFEMESFDWNDLIEKEVLDWTGSRCIEEVTL
jgi:hypothetical protein